MTRPGTGVAIATGCHCRCLRPFASPSSPSLVAIFACCGRPDPPFRLLIAGASFYVTYLWRRFITQIEVVWGADYIDLYFEGGHWPFGLVEEPSLILLPRYYDCDLTNKRKIKFRGKMIEIHAEIIWRTEERLKFKRSLSRVYPPFILIRPPFIKAASLAGSSEDETNFCVHKQIIHVPSLPNN